MSLVQSGHFEYISLNDCFMALVVERSAAWVFYRRLFCDTTMIQF